MRRSITMASAMIIFSYGFCAAYGQGPECPPPTPAQLRTPAVFEHAITKAKTLRTTKSEFETLAAFNARASLIAKQLAPEGSLVMPWLANESAFSYDAEKGIVRFSGSVLDTSCFVNPADESYALSRPLCTEQVFRSRTGKPEVRRNGFGARASVVTTSEEFVGLALGMERPPEGPLSYSSGAMFSFPATVEEARSLKKGAVLSLRVSPRPPFYIEASSYSEPTLDSPYESIGNSYLLVAQLRCVSIVDQATGKVFQTIAVPPTP